MPLPSHLFATTVSYTTADNVLILNSAAHPFALTLAGERRTGSLTLAEDHIGQLTHFARRTVRSLPFHDYIASQSGATMDLALMDLLYQPGKAWMLYGLRAARYALRTGGRLYVAGAKDRGILTMAKHMQAYFGNVETLLISKGQRVLCSTRSAATPALAEDEETTLDVFAGSKLDEGTRLLLEAIQVHATDRALDLGCGAGFIGLHIARQAPEGQVVMVDASLAAVAASRRAIEASALGNIEVLPSDGCAAVREQSFDLVATNPPFHLGGVQTTEIAERFIRESAQILRPRGRFYLVANRFLKYEPVIEAHYSQYQEVAGDKRYKVLLAQGPLHETRR